MMLDMATGGLVAVCGKGIGSGGSKGTGKGSGKGRGKGSGNVKGKNDENWVFPEYVHPGDPGDDHVGDPEVYQYDYEHDPDGLYPDNHREEFNEGHDWRPPAPWT